MTERWLPVVGHEGQYDVSDRGRVRSLNRSITDSIGRTYQLKGRLLKPHPNPGGYLFLNIGKSKAVHRLVLAAFVGPRPEDMVTRHLNGDPSDNRLENLAYGTQSENMQDRRRHGTDRRVNWTHCPSGHEYAGDNVRHLPGGKRKCQTCLTAKWARSYQRQVERAQARTFQAFVADLERLDYSGLSFDDRVRDLMLSYDITPKES